MTAAVPGGAPEPGGGRPPHLRMAGLHLRMGMLGLARAELEALAGHGVLDGPALGDLAEARWRTGDLAGAGEASDALLATGAEDGLALLIAAEAVAAAGRPGEARRLAGRALAVIDGPLEPYFAGMPRSMIWPGDAAAVTEPLDLVGPGEPIAVRAEPGPATASGVSGAATVTGRAAAPAGASLVPTPSPASSAAAEAFAGGRAALASGDAGTASVRLAVALRLDPGFAQGVVDAVGADATDPSLALVAGDALRLLGRESEALAAFERARGAGG